MSFQPLYMLMIERNGGEITLATTEDRAKLVMATEENKHLLEAIGDRLLKQDLIIGYQVIMTVSPPVRNYTPPEGGYVRPFTV